MNKIIAISLFIVLALIVTFANLYFIPSGIPEIPYLNYREEFAYNLKNPLIDKYRKQVIDQPVEILED